ncbi:MAG: hypothetical protein IKV17_00690 [Bacteroidaceae bacterium]|nr:hypothetical protein [Bacteroidaceae bacterium]
MAKKKTAPETAVQQNAGHSTVVSSADGTKVLKDLDSAIEEYKNKTSNRQKTFIGDLSRALKLRNNGNNSNYGTFTTVNGETMEIRVIDHNVSTKNMADAGKLDGISIVVTHKPNKGIKNDGDAHIVEFYYNTQKLQKELGQSYVEILKSIKQALYSGEYKDNTGLAEVQEVNSLNSQEESTLFREVAEKQGEDELALITDAVTGFGEKIGVPARVVSDAQSLPENKRNKKGWFENGEVVSNPSLRQMRTAADEYMAAIAEDVNLDKNVWQKIIDAVRAWLKKQGVDVAEQAKGILSKGALTDEDITELVRLSYENLRNSKASYSKLTESGNVKGESDGETRFSRKGGKQNIVYETGAARLDAAEGVTTRMKALETAKAMDDRGYDAWMIEQQTKWQKTEGGVWKYNGEKKTKKNNAAAQEYETLRQAVMLNNNLYEKTSQ